MFYGGKTVVRSTIECTEICCAYEIHMIEDVLKTVEGIEKIMINTTFKRVTIDHDVTVVTASELAQMLNDNSFGATIVFDGGISYEQQRRSSAAESPSRRRRSGNICQFIETDDATVRSHDTVSSAGSGLSVGSGGIAGSAGVTGKSSPTMFGTSIFTLGLGVQCDHPTESKLIGFLQTFSRKEISNFAVHVNTGQLTIVHNPLLLPASAIADQMSERTGLDLQIVIDGKDSIIWEFPTVSTDYMKKMEAIQKEKDVATSKLRPYVFLSGIFLVVSLLSYIGGNW